MSAAAEERSASSKTITGALPPSSRGQRLSVSAAARATDLPAAMLPVIETISGIGWLTTVAPVSRSPQTTLKTPGGGVSANSSAMWAVLAGVVSDGLRTMVSPAASAGANFQTAIIIG